MWDKMGRVGERKREGGADETRARQHRYKYGTTIGLKSR